MNSRGVQEQIVLIEEASLTKDGKDNPLIKPTLPVCDEGGMRFPCQNLFPFLHKFDSGNQLSNISQAWRISFQVNAKSNGTTQRLFPLFSSCFINFSNATITEVYTLLFDNMVNSHKKEMERSWERLDTHKNVSLNLRDELKPFAAKQK